MEAKPGIPGGAPERAVENEDDLRAAAEESLKRKRGFRVHLRVYILVNLLLWAIWAVLLATAGVGFPWPVFPLVGWGIGVAFHWHAVYRSARHPSVSEVAREMDRLRRN